jgi:hypothetical protein
MRSLLPLISCLLLAACAAMEHAEPIAETPSSPESTTEPATATGFISWSDVTNRWHLYHPNASDTLDFGAMTSCVAEATGQPCTASGLVGGMQLAVTGRRELAENGALRVETARIVGTSLTFVKSGTVTRRADGTVRFEYEDKGVRKTIPVVLNAETVCSDDGEHKPCGAWMNGRGGSVHGEVRRGETLVRATWIDLP